MGGRLVLSLHLCQPLASKLIRVSPTAEHGQPYFRLEGGDRRGLGAKLHRAARCSQASRQRIQTFSVEWVLERYVKWAVSPMPSIVRPLMCSQRCLDYAGWTRSFIIFVLGSCNRRALFSPAAHVRSVRGRSWCD